MKLGNRKAVVTGLTALAITSVSALSGFTTEAASDTNLINATPLVVCQNSVNMATAGINISSLHMPGQLSNTGYSVTTDEKGKELVLKAGIARLFSQNETTIENVKVAVKPVEEVEVASEEIKEESEVIATEVEVASEEITEKEETQQVPTAGVEVVLNEATEQVSAKADDEVDTDNTESTEETVTGSAIDVDENKESTESAEEEAITEDVADEWSDRVMADVEESVNIRVAANEEAEVIGKLYKGATADILEKGEEWTKISSGSIEEGYVKNDFLAFGDEAAEVAERDASVIATVATDGLRLRSEASEEGKILDMAENGEELTVVSEEADGWVEVEYTSKETAYVSSDYVNLDFVLGEAITIEEEKAIQEEKARKEAEARMKELENSEEAALLAALVKMEAGGESYEGKLAVASVVMNRVRSSAYPNTVHDVIYQSGQFPGVARGTLAACMGAGGDCKRAAVEALAGISNVGSLKHFNSISRIGTNGLVIGNHCFY